MASSPRSSRDCGLTAATAPRGSAPAPRRPGRRPACPRRARPRSSAASGTLARLGQLARAALEQQLVAGHEQPLRRVGGVVLARRAAARRPQLVAAGGAERGQQVEARGARPKPGSASRSNTRAKRRSRRPRRLAAERRLPASRRARPRRGRRRRCGARSAAGPAARRPPTRAAPRARALELGRLRPGEREQERQPRRLLEVGLGGDLRVRAGRLEPRRGGGQRGGEPLGVGGRAQAGDERVAVAVVGGAGEPARDDAAAAARRAARRAGAARGARRAGRGGALARSSACSSRLQIGQLAVRRLWRQNIGMASAKTLAAPAPRYPPRAGVSVIERAAHALARRPRRAQRRTARRPRAAPRASRASRTPRRGSGACRRRTG